MNTLIVNATLVTPTGERAADLLVSQGRIAAMGKNISADDGQRLDATGCLVFPGFIDAHTHLDMDTGSAHTADDFASGTAAALCGGTTTIVDFASQDRGMTLPQALKVWHQKAEGRSSCDYAFHMAISDWNERTRRELSEMVASGVTSFKLYFAYENLRVSDAVAYEVLKEVACLGGIVGVHCENGDLANELTALHRAQGHMAPQYHPLSRPEAIEAEAIERLLTIAEVANTPVMVVHVSSKRGIEAVRRARERGVKAYAETCPHYLVLDDGCYERPGFEGAKYVCSPPLRKARDRSALWQAVQQGEIDTIATDHCSFHYDGQKTLGKEDFSRIPNGLPGVEHRPAILYTAGVAAGRITSGDMARLLCENPARLYGMYPQKGALTVGSDADLVVWDPAAKGMISAARQHQAVDYTPYEGMAVQGAVRAVFLRGELVVQDGNLLKTGLGRYVSRGPAQFYR